MADNPNENLTLQALALLEGERDLERSSAAPQVEQHKGIIKDSTGDKKEKEKPASLTSNEEGRLKNIGKILGDVIGRELQIGKYKPGPEAGRLKMEQTKVGSAVNVPKAPTPEQSKGLGDLLKGLGDFLNNLLKFAWPALLLGIGIAAAKLYDDLGALGRGLTKMALKLAPHIGKIAKLGGSLFRGIGRLVGALGDAFKYFKAKGITGFLDDLKLKFPKTSQFVDDTIKLFDDFKNWFKKSWFGNALDSIKANIKARFRGLFVTKVKTASGKELELLTGLGAKVEKVKDWWKNTIGRILNLGFLKKAEKLADVADGAKDVGKFGSAVRKVMNGIRGIVGIVTKIGGWIRSGFSALTEIGGTVAKVFGKGKGGGILAKMLGGLFKGIGKILSPLLKKLPVIGAVMGVGFAWARFQKGEILPAVLELVSAILTFVPGIGTIGSIVIDGALMLYDMDKQKKEDAAKGIQPKESGGFFGKIGKWMSDWLLPKLRYLPVIGSFFYFADSITAFGNKDMFNGIDNLLKGLIALVGGKGLVDLVNNAYPIVMSFFTDKKEENAEIKTDKSGGFLSGLMSKIADFVIPKLKYVPIVGAFVYGKEAWEAFSSGSWGTGFLKLGQAIIALVGLGPVGSLINLGIDFVVSLFSAKEEPEPAVEGGGGSFLDKVKAMFMEKVLPNLKYLPVIGTFFYGKEAWDAFSSGQWGTGFLKLGQALISLVGGPIGSVINIGIDFISSIFSAEQTPEQEVKSQGGGFASVIKGAFDALVGIITGAIDSMVNWVKDTFASITQGAAEGVNAAMAAIPGGKYITAAGESLAKTFIPEPADVPAGVPPELAAKLERRRAAAAKYGFGSDVNAAAKAAGYPTLRQWEDAGYPGPKQQSMVAAPAASPPATFAQTFAAPAKQSMVAAPAASSPTKPAAPAASSPPTTFAQTFAAPAKQSMVAAPAASSPPASPFAPAAAKAAAPPATPPATPPAPATANTTATGAATSAIMSAFNISSQPSGSASMQQAAMPPGAAGGESVDYSKLTGGTQARNFNGNADAAFALARSLAVKAGSPDPDLTASIICLESGWLKSPMVRRANNPSGQTILKSQIGKNGVIGGTIGADGQLHAVYPNLETALQQHVRRWGSKYIRGNPEASARNLVANGYNTVNAKWAPHVLGIYSKRAGKSLPATDIASLGGTPPAITASAPAASGGGGLPSFAQTASAPAASESAATTMPVSATIPSIAQAAAPSLSLSSAPSADTSSFAQAAAPPASTPSPVPGGFDAYFNSPAFGSALAARGNTGARQVGGSWKSSSGTTLCAAGAMVVAGMLTGSDAIKTARIGSATNLARNPANPLTSTGKYKDMGALPQNYTPTDGDFVAMAGGSKGYGHALVYVGGRWYAHKSGDNTPQQYLSSGKYNSARLYRLTQAASSSMAIPDAIAGGASTSAAPSYASAAAPSYGAAPSSGSSSGGFFSGITDIFSSGGSSTAQTAGGGISNLSTSSTPSPMAATGAEDSITSKMDDIASKHISKADEEISVLKDIEKSIKELNKQISALSRVTINNVSGGDGKTSITNANIPDTDTRLKPQTGGGFLGGKMFGFA